MSKCDFEIEFDRENRTYQAGERVSGTVRLQVNKTVPCRKVVIQGFWKTHGRGNQASDKYFEQVVYEGELTEGQSYEFKFEFEADDCKLLDLWSVYICIRVCFSSYSSNIIASYI